MESICKYSSVKLRPSTPTVTQVSLKRITKLLVSLCYFTLCEAYGMIAILGRRPRQAQCTVLYYHSVDSRLRGRFARQMDTLVRHTVPVAADMGSPLAPGHRYSVVTFDDGLQNVVDNALPELEKREIPCTIFVIAGILGKTVPWNTVEPDRALNGIMSEEQLRDLPSKLVTIGAHTMTHPRLPLLAAEAALREIRGSRLRLETLLSKKVTLFSFPYGAFNQQLIHQCREAGFERVFTTLPGPAFSNPTEYVTKRVGLEASDWPLEFRLKLFGAYAWLPAAFSIKRKILGLRRSFFNRLNPPDGASHHRVVH